MKNYEIIFTAISAHVIEATSEDEASAKADEIFTAGIDWSVTSIDTTIEEL